MKSRRLARIGAGRIVAAVLAGLSGAVCVAATSGAAAATSPELAALQATWREAISRTPTPDGGGCFTAHYPSIAWSKAACVTAPNVPFIPKNGRNADPQTVGDGDDYAISTKTLISTGVGSFTSVKGLKSETGQGQANAYTLQLNSEFFNGPVCAGAQTPSKCLTWLQYVYYAAPGQSSVFMQYWLINWDKTCPAGWNSFSPDCYKNSASVRAPQEPITDLSQMSITGSAVNGGLDTTIFADGANAYKTTGPDTVVDLAGAWNGSEFNVIGPGGGSEADFNAGTKLTVGIAVTDGSTAKPKCLAHAGTTGETNNLNLGACKAKAGDTPSISFVESN
jgi:hypothetical protein